MNLIDLIYGSGASQAVPSWFFTMIAFAFGAMVGSFLNVCIHRMPREESIVKPRSRCYSCGKMIPWYDNIPLLSYLLLRGKCRICSAPFSIRYWLVELLTAIVFVIIWQIFPIPQAITYTIFVCGLIVATFIDFEHYIIPNEITLGGIVVGLLCSGFFPSIQNQSSHFWGALMSLLGAAIGYGLLWGVVEFGKKVFGVKKVELPQSVPFSLTKEGIHMDSETEKWEEIFSRESDVLKIQASELKWGEKTFQSTLVEVDWQEVRIGDEKIKLEELAEITGKTKMLFVPREAMGFGDVKFLGAIGAFLGAKSIFFVILTSSLAGTAIGLSTMILGKKEWGTKIPYGPYLALGALLWIFGGSEWMTQYMNLMQP
jgi:leader peptidase (prepilin peptidase) / N-methyltransferase